MKIPLSWISLYSPLESLLAKYTIRELAHEYSIHTAEIDGIEEHFLDKVVIGKVLSCEKHTESKKLSIVRVSLGEYGEETILTGAANISEAKYVPVAIVGAILPGNFTIGERMMAGMMSRGMICGADEIGMSTEASTGIMILEDDWKEEILETMIGKSFFDLTLPFPGRNGEIYRYPLRDVTFEIDNKFITNRPDLFSIVGNAREFHAVFEVPFTPYTGVLGASHEVLHTQIETPKCLSYHLMKMEHIQVGKSPWGISLMMERAGLCPKMDIVDITNLVMTELGQPMHAFDADKISGDISVRMAKKGEKILALNANEYELTENDMIIADESGPVALAGVIGGMDSAVSEGTTSIIWESACFDATSVRLTAQRHGIRTDASTRYEKSLDPLLAGTTFDRVIEYMRFLGKELHISGTSSYLDRSQVNDINIDIEYDFINMKAGMKIDKQRVDAILTRLGFTFQKINQPSSTLTITVPSWRASKDISIQEDIAEEISRVIGYDHVPLSSLPLGQSILEKNIDMTLRDMTLDHFKGAGWNEVYTYSFTNDILDKKILLEDMSDAVSIQNAFNEEYTHMRRSLAPRLLLSLSENMKYAVSMGFFEIGKIYSKNPYRKMDSSLLQNIAIQPLPERKIIAGVLTGDTLEHLRKTLESYIKNVLGYLPPVHTGTSLPLLHPGISGSYREEDISIVDFGMIHPEVATAFGLPQDTLYFEADFKTLEYHLSNKDLRFQPISRYQTLPRELNFMMPKHTPTGDIARMIDSLHPWIQNITVASVYEDAARIGIGKKSVNFAFILSNHDATISDDDALKVQNLIIDAMKKHGFELRGIES